MPNVGDKVRVTKDTVLRLVGLTGTLVGDDSGDGNGDDEFPYQVEFDDSKAAGRGVEWVERVELVKAKVTGIDPQELSDYIHFEMGELALLRLREHFNLPVPTLLKKTMTVTLTIDVTDRGGEFRELGDTYGAFTSLIHEQGSYSYEMISALETLTNEKITVTIEEEKR